MNANLKNIAFLDFLNFKNGQEDEKLLVNGLMEVIHQCICLQKVNLSGTYITMENAIKILTCIDDKTNSNNANIFEVDFSNIQNDWKPSEFTNFVLLEYKSKKPIQINFKGSFWVRSGENVDALQRDLDDLRKVKFKNTPVIVDKVIQSM